MKIPKKIEKKPIVVTRCHICGHTFRQNAPKLLQKHIFYQHNENGQSEFMCDMCGKYFYDIGDFNKHVDFEHGDGNDLICDTCGVTVKSKSELKLHKQEHWKSGTRLNPIRKKVFPWGIPTLPWLERHPEFFTYKMQIS